MSKLKHYNGRVPACGVYCGGCPMYTRDKKPCPGAEINFKRCEGCKSFHLCCLEKGIHHCFQCNKFPCSRFKDFSGRWEKYGQKLMDNQLFLKEKGVEVFLNSFNKKAKD